MKIVSLLPSATEIICELGFKDHLVGRSHECTYPPSVQTLPVLTKPALKNSGSSSEIDKNITSLIENGLSIFQVKAELLADIDPDIIFTQDHCEVCAVSLNDVNNAVNNFCNGKTKVISLSPANLSEVFQTFTTIGEALGNREKGLRLADELNLRLGIIRNTVIGEPVKRVAGIEWMEPLMTGGNWIPELLEIAGGEYLLSEPGKHSPWIGWNDIKVEDPDVILIMPCGYELDQTRKEIHLLTQKEVWKQLKAVRNGEVYLLDGNRYFNRPGTGIYESARILGEVLHPNLFKPIHHKSGWVRLTEGLNSTSLKEAAGR